LNDEVARKSVHNTDIKKLLSKHLGNLVALSICQIIFLFLPLVFALIALTYGSLLLMIVCLIVAAIFFIFFDMLMLKKEPLEKKREMIRRSLFYGNIPAFIGFVILMLVYITFILNDISTDELKGFIAGGASMHMVFGNIVVAVGLGE